MESMNVKILKVKRMLEMAREIGDEATILAAENKLVEVEREALQGPQDLLPYIQEVDQKKLNFYNSIIPKKELVAQKASAHYETVLKEKERAILKLQEDHMIMMDKTNKKYQDLEAQAEEALRQARMALDGVRNERDEVLEAINLKPKTNANSFSMDMFQTLCEGNKIPQKM